jgi:hypothetical protein
MQARAWGALLMLMLLLLLGPAHAAPGIPALTGLPPAPLPPQQDDDDDDDEEEKKKEAAKKEAAKKEAAKKEAAKKEAAKKAAGGRCACSLQLAAPRAGAGRRALALGPRALHRPAPAALARRCTC